MSTLSDESFERSNGAATMRAAKDTNGFDLVSMIADGRLPMPAIARTLGFTLDSVGNGEAVIVYEPGESHYNPMGTVHGGLPATLNDSAARAATLLFEAGGAASLDAGSPLARTWRDVHALPKHVAVSPLGYEAAAAGLLDAEG